MNGRWLDMLAPVATIVLGLVLIALGVAMRMWWIA